MKLTILISTAFIVISAANIFGGYLFLVGGLTEKKIIIIEPNSSIHKISVLLEQEQIIKYRQLFEVISKIYAYYTPLKSGEYEFSPAVTPYQVIRTLAAGKSIVHRLFIPEGYTVHEILELINSETRLVGTINDEIKEGYLMPSTYFYSYGDKRQTIVNLMKKQMSRTLDEAMSKLSASSPLKTRSDILIMASIIEKEAGYDDERNKIAAVFLNRLKKGMKLQADPTTAYAITNGKYKLTRSLTRADLKTSSPYNTYHIYGLPTGPISCPGRASLEAAVSPAISNDLYFVVNGLGGHSFSQSLKEHNMYVQKYKERVRQQKLSTKND
ncbi:MAG: endolytic transglycosylase MltG [Rickettsiaceae bacterium]|nr:endolytic transglycosylase MltG [Rickettsiaceae bacterium]